MSDFIDHSKWAIPSQLVFPPIEAIERVPASSSRKARKDCARALRVDGLVVSAVNCLNRLWVGGESEDTGSVKRFPVNHPVYDSLRGKCSEFSGMLDCEDRPNGYQSFVELTKVGCSYNHANRSSDIEPARGEIVGAILGDIDIPSPESVCNLDGAKIFAEALPETFLQGTAADLIRDDVPDISDIKAFCDPVLAPGSPGLIELAALLVIFSVCEPAARLLPESCGVRVFTVSKGGVGPKSQRMIWDCRRVSAMCKAPPPVNMGSLGALCDLEPGCPRASAFFANDVPLSSPQFSVSTADLACYFYSLRRILAGLSSILFLEGVHPLQVKACLEAWLRGKPLPGGQFKAFTSEFHERIKQVLGSVVWGDEHDYSGPPLTVIGCVSPAMGFSWSPWLAQCISQYLASKADPSAKLIVHRDSLHSTARDNAWRSNTALLVFLDDLTMLARSIEQRLDLHWKVEQACKDAGLLTHKEQYGEQLKNAISNVNEKIISLGVCIEVQNGDLIIRPRPEKMKRLITATEFLLTVKQISRKALQRIVGHWSWLLQLNRLLYSLFHAVYGLIVDLPSATLHTQRGYMHSGEKVILSHAVKTEFSNLISLAPFLTARLSRVLGKEIFMVDAGPDFGAVVKANLKAGTKFSSDVHHAEYRHLWHLVFTHRWKFAQHNNLCEGRCILWGLQLGEPGSRVVIFTDSLVCLGAFSKGRSGSFALNRLCRKALSISIARDIKLSLFYVPSHQNYADGPSRGLLYPSVAQGTLQKCRDANPAEVDVGANPAEVDVGATSRRPF